MKQDRKIILASASPRRKELMEKTGLKFSVDPSDFPEDITADSTPEELVASLSRGKAGAVAPKYPDALIIAADTIGVLRKKIIGKPHTAAAARAMLHELSGMSHRVITGLTVIDSASGRSITRVVETRVYIKPLSEEEISAYVRTGEPLDKAGAYAIQGLGALIVRRIEGDFYNVIGLPLNTLAECLQEFGVSLL